MGVYIKNMEKPKRGEVIAFDGENAVYTDDDLKVYKYPLIEIDENAFNEVIKGYLEGLGAIQSAERRNDE